MCSVVAVELNPADRLSLTAHFDYHVRLLKNCRCAMVFSRQRIVDGFANQSYLYCSQNVMLNH